MDNCHVEQTLKVSFMWQSIWVFLNLTFGVSFEMVRINPGPRVML